MSQERIDNVKEVIAEFERVGDAISLGIAKNYRSLLAEIELLQAEVERLKFYTDPKLFAAACTILESWERYTITHGAHSLLDALEADMPELRQAVAWWDSLPFDPEKDTEKLPKYEG